MINKTFVLSALAALAMCEPGCAKVTGSGKVISDTRAVAGAHGVELASVGELTIVQGDKEELVIEAEDNLMPLIESGVNGDGLLTLRFKENGVRPTKPVRFKLTLPHLDLIALSGSGKINAEHLKAEAEHIRLPGSGSISLGDLEAPQLSVTLEGSGEISIGGTGQRQKVDLTGSGSYQAESFKTDSATVSISGSGEARVHAETTLEARISGSGEVVYSGDPKVTKQISGSGGVTHK